MCTPDGAGCALAAPGRGFASVDDALRVGEALGAYLNSPAAADLEAPARGEALEALGAITSLLGAAANGLLRRFDAGYDHDADGYASSSAWLAAKNHLAPRDARAAVRHMRLLARHPHLDAATTTGALTISWAQGDRRLDRPHRPRRTPGRGRQDPRRRRDRRGGPRRPQARRAGRLRGVARPGTRPGGRPPRARVRRPGPAPRDDHGRGGADPGRPDPRVRRRRHRRPGGARQAPRARGLPHHRAAVPRRPPGRLRAPHPREDGPRPGRIRHPRRRHHPPVRPAAHGRRVGRRGHLAPREGRRARLPIGQGRRGRRLRRPHRPHRHRRPRTGTSSPR